MTLLPSRDRDRRARMTTMAVRPSRKPPQNPFLTTTTPDELPPAQRLAYDIVAERRDLTPSVDADHERRPHRGRHRRRADAVPVGARRPR